MATTKKTGGKKSIPSKKSTTADNTEVLKAFATAFTSRQVKTKSKPNSKAIQDKEIENNIKFAVPPKEIASALSSVDTKSTTFSKLPEDAKKGIQQLKESSRRFHGVKLALTWFPFPVLASPCADKFGYMSSPLTRLATRLPFTPANKTLMEKLGELMGDAGRDTGVDSNIPAGFTYVGQFVDHDITMDISSSIDTFTDANTINNMRSPSLDLDSLYARGPGLDPFLYDFPSSGPATAIKFQLGTNRNVGPGGPGGVAGIAGMKVQTNFDVPRIHNPLNPPASSHTAIIGDPRNDENLIVTQFHHAMLKFHNKVVDFLLVGGFPGDIFTEAKRRVTHHYQWAVLNDFVRRICGGVAVNNALASVIAPVGSPFRMPVEFAVAAYRLGHSMIRDRYWVNFNFPNATLGQVFQFNRNPNLPILSNWVVDFNAFFDTGIPVPINNKARKIDSVMANGLESIPGGSGIMAILATRNLRRSLALGLPSGQGMAKSFGIAPMTAAQLTDGLPANEIAILTSNSSLLLRQTPLWYYILRESKVLRNGDQLGPVGAKIVADTFVRILKRDATSFLNVTGGFTPNLPSAVPGNFTFVDLIKFSGVNQPV
jgi:hypothetical protein